MDGTGITAILQLGKLRPQAIGSYYLRLQWAQPGSRCHLLPLETSLQVTQGPTLLDQSLLEQKCPEIKTDYFSTHIRQFENKKNNHRNPGAYNLVIYDTSHNLWRSRLWLLVWVWLGGPSFAQLFCICQPHSAPSHPWGAAFSPRVLHASPHVRCLLWAASRPPGTPSLGHPLSPATISIHPDDIHSEAMSSAFHLHIKEVTWAKMRLCKCTSGCQDFLKNVC